MIATDTLTGVVVAEVGTSEATMMAIREVDLADSIWHPGTRASAPKGCWPLDRPYCDDSACPWTTTLEKKRITNHQTR